jgi:hypothetical protein
MALKITIVQVAMKSVFISTMSCAYSASPKALGECCRLMILTWYPLYAGEAKKLPQRNSVRHLKQVILSH